MGGRESRKKIVDDAWLKPKHKIMGNQQPSSEKEKVQRLSAWERLGCKCLASEVVCPSVFTG
jgi:hypothetical protein|nr:MAG TPA: hypothetical protein [Caudoviricetes sp.]